MDCGKRHLVYIIDSLRMSGGISRIVTCKANWWVAHGYKVSILTTEDNDSYSFYPLSNNVKVIPLSIHLLSIYGNKRSLIGLLRSGFDRWKKNKLLYNKISSYLLSETCDVVFTTSNIASLNKIKDGSKKVYELHFSSEAQANFIRRLRGGSRLLYKIYNHFNQKSLLKYDKLILLTERDRILKKNPLNSVVIPNFVTIIPPENKARVLASKHVVSVGRLDTPKGYDLLFRAWFLVAKKHPDWSLDIYGYGYEREDQYYRQIEQLGLLRQITIHKPVSNIIDKYLDSSFYVMSSLYEGFPLVLGEAMACGLPCVSYDCNCGPSEIISDNEDGILVSPVGDIQALADAIIFMIENPEVRANMGHKASINIQRYYIDSIMPVWEKLLQTI